MPGNEFQDVGEKMLNSSRKYENMEENGEEGWQINKKKYDVEMSSTEISSEYEWAVERVLIQGKWMAS